MDGDQDISLSERMTDSLNGPVRVGAELRRRRERLGLNIEDVGARLKIRLGFLEAIEEGDLAALPAPAYAAGFIRSYAEALHLDPEEVLRRFRAEGMTRKNLPVLSFPEAPPDRGVPSGAIALLIGVAAIGAYAAWYYESAPSQRAVDQVPPVPAKFAALTLPKPPPMPSKTIAAAQAVTQLTSQAPIPAPAVIPFPPPQVEIKAPALPPAPTPAAQAPMPPLPFPPAPLSAKALAAAQVAFTPRITVGHASETSHSRAPVPAQANNIVLIATSRTWVQIRNLHGKILFSRVMLPGESWPLPDEPGLTLTTGNAGGTALIRNGVPGPPLGPSGSVVHDVLITPSGTIVPPLPSPPTRRSGHHRQAFGSGDNNPFAISTKGEQ